MEFLRDWFLGTAGAAMAGVFALAVTPPGASRKVVRIASALVLCIAVLRPLTGIGGIPDLQFEGELSAPAAGMAASVNELLEPIIAERTCAYIETKAQALGLTVSVSVRCQTGEFWPEPWSVAICHERPEHARSALGKLIEQDLGIPPERQTYEEGRVGA